MCFVGIVTNDNISRLQISMNIALGVYALQAIHELQCNNDDSLDLKLALLERFFKLFQVDTEQLHY